MFVHQAFLFVHEKTFNTLKVHNLSFQDLSFRIP